MSGDFKLGVLIGLLILALMVIFLTNKPRTDELASDSALAPDQQEAFVTEEPGLAEAIEPDFAQAQTQTTPSDAALLSVQEPAAASAQPKELLITQAASDDRTVAAQIGGRRPSDTQPDSVAGESVEADPAAKKIEDSTFPLLHVAAKGETLSSISAKYYGTHKWFRHIYKANAGTMKNPDAVSVGQKITVPAPPKVRVQAAPAEPTRAAKAQAPSARSMPSFVPRKHTVKKGDSLCQISRTYYNGDESMWKRILNANRKRISNPRKLRVGAMLVIPAI